MTRIEIRGRVLMGEACLRLGMFPSARRVFEAAGEEMPKDVLIACGLKAMEMGNLTTASKAFEAAGHRGGLIACGEEALRKGWFDTARKALVLQRRAERAIPHRAQESWRIARVVPVLIHRQEDRLNA